LKKNEGIDPLFIFFVAITNIAPEVLLFPLKKAGIINQVPMPISNKKQIIFSTKWIIKLLKDKYSILNLKSVSDLLIDSLHNNGYAIDKKRAAHLLAKNNRYLLKFFK
jgi:small subunit ribosomal protein S7